MEQWKYRERGRRKWIKKEGRRGEKRRGEERREECRRGDWRSVWVRKIRL